MDALRRFFIDAYDKVLIDTFRDERHQRRRRLYERSQRRIERHIGVHFVPFHAFRPKALPAAAHVPVAQFVNEGLKGLGGLRHFIIGKIAVYFPNHRIQTRQDPFIHDRQRRVLKNVLRRIELVDLRIQDIEGIGIPKRAHELSLAFLHGGVMVPVWQPRGAVLIEIPSHGVSAVFFQRVHRIDGVPLRF